MDTNPTDEPTTSRLPVVRKSHVRRVLQVASGNFLESYDVLVFAYFAPSIGRAFFPNANELASLMATFMTFGAAYLIRPLGALLLGPYIDHYGRRRGLILTLALLAAGTLAIAATPAYASIGLLAPALVVLGRLVQGLSAGVEYGGVSAYLAEIAPQNRKGLFVSWQSASTQVATVAAALAGVAANRLLSPKALDAWGWRLPFWLGCAIIPLLFRLRHSLLESDEFAARSQHPGVAEILRSLLRNRALVFSSLLIISLSNASFFLITTYTPTFGKAVLHLGQNDALLVTGAVGLSNLVLVPLFAFASDVYGRRPVLAAASLLVLTTAYPALKFLVHHASFGHLLLVELYLSVLYSAYNGALIVYVTEIVPVEIRVCGFSLAYSLSQALFGGFTPLICTWLIDVTKDKAIPGAWLSATALCGLAGLVALRPRDGTCKHGAASTPASPACS